MLRHRYVNYSECCLLATACDALFKHYFELKRYLSLSRCFMKKLLAAAAIVAVSTPALAADLPVHTYTKAPAIAAPVSGWTGWYVGGNVGYGWGKEDGNWGVLQSTCAPGEFLFCPAGAQSNRLNGALGGVQAGYNRQFGRYLAGVETDIQYSGLNGRGSISSSFPLPLGAGPLAIPISGTNSERLEWFGTLRGRLGIISDRWLLYATGGLAYGEVHVQGTVNATGIPFSSFTLGTCMTAAGCPIVPLGTSNISQTRIGWTAGAGVERDLGAHWTLKAEYLFVDLGHANATFTTVPGCFGNGNTGGAACLNVPSSPGFFSTLAASSLVRLGLNYRF
jgi:outer membrane immunogenic protein